MKRAAETERRWADISPCGRYRYQLGRQWDDSLPTLEWIMLNPSTADATQDDPTIRRCKGFAKLWGYGSIIVHNLFAFRSTSPQVLENMEVMLAYGPFNRRYVEGFRDAPTTIAAWGANPAAEAWFACGFRVHRPKLLCLGTTANGMPKHPLYVPSATHPTEWSLDVRRAALPPL